MARPLHPGPQRCVPALRMPPDHGGIRQCQAAHLARRAQGIEGGARLAEPDQIGRDAGRGHPRVVGGDEGPAGLDRLRERGHVGERQTQRQRTAARDRTGRAMGPGDHRIRRLPGGRRDHQRTRQRRCAMRIAGRVEDAPRARAARDVARIGLAAQQRSGRGRKLRGRRVERVAGGRHRPPPRARNRQHDRA